MTLDRDAIRAMVKRGYDLHLHVGPDILPRKYTVEEIVREDEGKIAGIALKAHSFPTISSINAATRGRKLGLDLIGSVTLNYFMGGFNPSAIYASATLSREFPIIVWFPTMHAENHLKKNYSEYEIPPEWVRDEDFKPRRKEELKAIRVTDWNGSLYEKCVKVLEMMKKMGCILGTGHLSAEEAETLSVRALEMGIPVIVTHPNQRDIAMPIEVQRSLASHGAFIEHCYIMYKDRDHEDDYPLDEMADFIRAVGAGQCLLTSDAGQLRNPGASESLAEFIELLSREGITKQEFEQMIIENPRRLLGIEAG